MQARGTATRHPLPNACPLRRSVCLPHITLRPLPSQLMSIKELTLSQAVATTCKLVAVETGGLQRPAAREDDMPRNFTLLV